MRPEPATPSFPLPREDRGKFITAACNGTALYILTYYLVWGLHQVAKLGMSYHYHLRGNWDPSRIRYTLGDGEWWRTAIIAVHGIGPAVCLLVGAVAFRYFWYSERASRGQFKLLLMWLAMHCCNAVSC